MIRCVKYLITSTFYLCPAVVTTATVMMGLMGSVFAQQWNGNASFSAQTSRTAPSVVPKSGTYNTRAFVNIEDVLFYKTRLRLGGNFTWRDEMYSVLREFRPIYNSSLSGYGYVLTSTYSPFWRFTTRPGDSTGSKMFRVYHRDWRTTLAISVPRYPSLNLVFNRFRQFDREAMPTYNSLQRTWVVESNFQRNQYSLKGNYNRRRQDNHVTGQVDDVVRSMSGTVSLLANSLKLGSASATYNYYDSKRTLGNMSGEATKTHSMSLLVANSFVPGLSATASYSGRFIQTLTRFAASVKSRAETMSGSLSYSPTNYAELQVVKTYQLEGFSGQYEISEYIALSSILSRYIKRGVDTRLAVTHTLYQQSSRVIEYRDSAGNIDSSQAIDHFNIDTWYGSINFSPRPYISTNASYSISRDSKPLSNDRKYQSTGTINSKLALTDRIDIHIGYTSIYVGERLRIGRAFSENWNGGVNWAPRYNLNVSITYIHSDYNTSVKNSSNNMSIYASYRFRRAFSCYVSYGQQDKKQSDGLSGAGTSGIATSHPKTLNTQLLIYTGRQSTLTLAYLKSSETTDLDGLKGRTETYQAVFNFQI